MSDPNPYGTLRHMSYFESLAMTDESTPEWKITTAGLLTMRLVDTWLWDGRKTVARDSWGVRSVRSAIDEIEERYAFRALLHGIVDAMQAARSARMSKVAPRLMAYGRALQFEAQWSLAGDVYRTVVDNSNPIEDADMVGLANLQLGVCHRRNAEWTEAAAAFARAGEIAQKRGDMMGVLRARMYEANIAMDRGNFPRAEAILEETVQAAGRAGDMETTGLALHGRADLAHRRGEYELSVRLAYQALRLVEDPAARDRVLADLAASFQELGVTSAARDAHLILAATAQEQYVRWASTLNLMEIAALDHREPVFEQHRRELAAASLPAKMETHYHFYVGQGHRAFGHVELARDAFTRAVELAARHQINDILIKAEACLQEIEDGGVVIISATPEPSPEVERVAGAVREMRELAGVGG